MTNAGPPDDELTALFGAERAQHVFSDQLRVSVLRGVERAILLAPAVIVGVGAAAAVGSAGAAAASKAWTTKVVITIAALSFGVGTVAGVVGTKVLTPRPRATPIAVTSATAVRTAELPLAPAPPNSEPVPEPAPPPTAPSARPPATPASAHGAEASPSTLARESEIIEKGRTALARGRAADALAAVDEHKRLFPRGRLGEERDELAIRALRFAGRSDEADARAKEFAKTYPSSIYLGTVEAPKR